MTSKQRRDYLKSHEKFRREMRAFKKLREKTFTRKAERAFIRWFSTWPYLLKWWVSDFLYWFVYFKPVYWIIEKIFRINVGSFNFLLINMECEAHKGELVLGAWCNPLGLCKLIRFDEDEQDYYWVVQDLEQGEAWHSACGGFTPIKGCIFGRYYYKRDYDQALATFDKAWADPERQKAIKERKIAERKRYRKLWG